MLERDVLIGLLWSTDAGQTQKDVRANAAFDASTTPQTASFALTFPTPQFGYCDGNNNVYAIGIGTTNRVYALNYDEVALLADVLEVLPNRGALLPPPPRAAHYPKMTGISSSE